jgi:hypothetical protein
VRRTPLALLAVLALTACSRIERDEVVGTYVLNNKTTEFSLQLKADGTYVHTRVQGDNQIMVRTGKWEWDEKDADNPLCLDNFRGFAEEGLGVVTDSPVIFILHPERSAHGIRFPVGDPDASSLYFVRRDSQPH